MIFRPGYAIACAFCFFIISSCNWKKDGNSEDRIVAQIQGENLYYSQIKPIAESASGSSDSADVVNNFIEDWLKRKLMIQKALLYLPEEEYNIEKQVRDYRESLLLYLYEKELILQKLDTAIREENVRSYYEDHKKNFELPEDIVQMHYVKLPIGAPEADSIPHWLSSNEEIDRMRLEEFCYRTATDCSLSDSTWITVAPVYRNIPVSEEQFSSMVRSKKPTIVTDPLFMHVIRVNDTKGKGEIGPYHFIRNDIVRILLNKRKVELVRKTYDNVYLEALRNKTAKILAQ